ncbi:prion-inhibition and propagation-domain-containing protein [Bisporella sp. PMI_857]|nr:prion-inhibition and propagation-domain-containing protein [Bisporella sp. PMI_857]
MEPAGLSVGLLGMLGLFSACVDIIEKFDTFKAFSHELRQLSSIFEVDKIRFQEWARSVGISNGKLEKMHHARLDDPEVTKSVRDVLQSICETLGAGEQMQSRLRIQSKNCEKALPPPKLEFSTKPTVNKTEAHVSVKGRLDWTFRRRGKFARQVEMFHQLLEQLFSLVPLLHGSLAKTFPDTIEMKDSAAISTHVFTSLQTDIQILLKEKQESARRQALKNVDEWLDAVILDCQFEDCVEARLEGTCEWIFEHSMFQAWMQPSQHFDSKILWINGGAGQGKSVMCAKIVQFLQLSQSEPSAYFFSSVHARAKGRPRDIARSWLSQLARQDPDALDTIRGHMEGKEAGRRALQPKVWDILEDILQSKPQQTLILDGLDEYDRTNDNRASFLRTLRNRAKATGTRILLPESWIAFDCQITENNVRPDITRFSQYTVDYKLPGKDQDLRQDIAQQMADKCQGMFLWIKMQQDHLRGSKNRKKLQDIVNKMPTGLTNTYLRNWKAIQKQEEEERERAITILRWIVFAARPLTVSELTDALLTLRSDHKDTFPIDELPEAIDDEYISGEIKDICGSLVDFRVSGPRDSPASRTIHLVHFSVREFLVSVLPTPYEFHDLKIAMSQETCHHTVLAETCLRYLNYSNVWQVSKTLTGSKCLRPFINYASTSWPTHYRQDHSSLLSIFEKFFKDDNLCFQNWRDYFESNYISGENEFPNEIIEPSTSLYYLALFGITPALKVPSQEVYRNLNLAGGRYGSPLSAACSNGHLEIFEMLIKLSPDINAEGGQFGSALNAAISKNQEKMVRTLLSLGASQNARDFTGQSAVYIASKGGFKDMPVKRGSRLWSS